jgi:hypothetical protein
VVTACAWLTLLKLTDIVSWVGLQTEGLPMIPTVSANMSAEFVRPAGGAGDVLWIVANKIQRGELKPSSLLML